MEDQLKRIEKQNTVIISLLSKLVYKQEDIKNIIVHKKKNPKKILNLYNLLDGKKGIVELSKIVKLDKGTISRQLKNWESQGLIYNLGDSSKPEYEKLAIVE